MQFHQSYSYEDFVQGYRPSDDANPVELDYVCDPRTGLAFPGIWLVLRHPEENRELEVQCHLDSGAGVSLFDGQMGKAIGLERERGRPIVFSATTGAEVVARLHRVRIEHTQLGERQVEIVQ